MKTVGELMNVESGNFLFEARSNSIPGLRQIKETILENRAFGCAISGSGPAIFAIAACQDDARLVRDKVVDRFADRNLKWLISPMNVVGSKAVSNIDDWLQSSRGHHNFW